MKFRPAVLFAGMAVALAGVAAAQTLPGLRPPTPASFAPTPGAPPSPAAIPVVPPSPPANPVVPVQYQGQPAGFAPAAPAPSSGFAPEPARSVEELLNDLARLKAERVEFERGYRAGLAQMEQRENKLVDLVQRKLAEQKERMKELGVKAAGEPLPAPPPPAPAAKATPFVIPNPGPVVPVPIPPSDQRDND